MLSLRDMTIKRKLTTILMLTSTAAVFIACTAFFVFSQVMRRRALVRDLTTLSDVIGNNCQAALAFKIPEDAEKMLAALGAKPSIVYAGLYDAEGRLFAVYERDAGRLKATLPSGPPGEAHFFGDDFVEIFHAIRMDGQLLGTILMRDDMRELNAAVARDTLMLAAVMIFALGAALLISWKLQKYISSPILELAETARAVSDKKDYSVRAAGASGDEVGLLIDSFNAMLAQIQERDRELVDSRRRAEERAREAEKAHRELAREMAERLKAEELLRESHEELERRVRERTQQLEAANRELEAFTYSVSHDLRAPLRSIDGFSQALLEDCAEQIDEAGKDYLKRVRAAAERMDHLIDDLLGLSRLTRSELRRETVDLSAMARSIVDELRRSAPERKVEFAIQPDLSAEGDPRLLRAMLENLLENAWKFTGKREFAVIEFGSNENSGLDRDDPKGEKVFFVRDNGAGFDMAYSDKLFGAFQRLHNTNEFPGTGIGTATVQRIVSRHGGRVWAEGRVNEGAVFYFTL